MIEVTTGTATIDTINMSATTTTLSASTGNFIFGNIIDAIFGDTASGPTERVAVFEVTMAGAATTAVIWIVATGTVIATIAPTTSTE